jgi:hypothetical protein
MKTVNIEWGKLVRLLLFVAITMILFGYLAYSTQPDSEKIAFWTWLNGKLSFKYIIVSLSAGISFGFIDNMLLLVGIDSIDTFCRRFCPGSDNPIFLAGYGHTFATVVSAFISTFIGKWVANITNVNVDDGPVWSLAFGILIGSLFGLVLCSIMLRQ